ncbi:MAG: S8 family serine peptidase [Candidatus Cloacimonadaceae bacterium]|nr:S8 family serine peptidase [Candidatus Cloacimonadaceae bacterium]
MKKALLLCIAALLPLLILANAIPGDDRPRPLYAPNIVKIQLSAPAIRLTNLPEALYAEADLFGIDELDEIMASFGTGKVIRAHIRLKDTRWESEHGVQRWFLVRFEHDIDVPSAIKAFKASGFIDEATPEYYAYTQVVPNDQFYPNNWGHNNTAQLPAYQGGSHSGPGVGTIGFDSNAEAAWDDTQGFGSFSIVIAIIDSGVDTAHPDLLLVPGYDYGDNDNNPMDNSAQAGHGTACSGVAAGIGNNSIGVAGMAPGCSVMPLKVSASSGSLGFTAIANALYHCGDNNVDVASMSFGASIAYGSNPSTDAAVAYAYTHGVVMFAATANDNTSTIAYPSNHPNVISVGAASPTGQRKSSTSSDGETWWGSNYGVNTQDAPNSVDIMAPTILPTTDITGTAGYSTTNYSMWFNGTSCATPYAAGVAGLLLSKNPALTPAEVRTAITSTATDMTFDGGLGWDRYTGYGLVNAQGALASLVPGMPNCQITSPPNNSLLDLGGIITISVNASDPDVRSIQWVEFFLNGNTRPSFADLSAPYAWAWDTSSLSGGTYTIRAVATDDEGNSASQQITISLIAGADEGFETGNFSAYPWAQSGTLPWTVQSTDLYSGLFAAKSGAITHNQTTGISLVLDIESAGNVSFFRKVSSESNYDYLYFYIDNVLQGSWSGTVPWEIASYPVATGIREFRWTYYKDGAVTSGSDCAWLDHITFPNHSIATPADITWDPPSIILSVPVNGSTQRSLNIGNSGDQNLIYSAGVPTGLVSVLDESFATPNIPAGWSQVYVTGTTSWTYSNGGNSSNPPAAYDGSYNARMYYTQTTARVTRLITPELNLSNAGSATLTFWHTQALRSSYQDELRVYYRTTATGTWTLLTAYTNNIPSWTMETINLPSLSGTYYLAFEGTARSGYGVCLDKVMVIKNIGGATPWVSLNGASSANGIITREDPQQVLTVGFDTAGLTQGTYTSTITINSNSDANSVVTIPVNLTVGGLSPVENLVITRNATTGAAVLVWDAASGDPDGYNVYYATEPGFAPGSEIFLGYVPAPQTGYTDATAGSRDASFYRVRAVINP